MNLKNSMMHERITKDYMLYESNHMKFPEEARTEIEQRSVIARQMRAGVACNQP